MILDAIYDGLFKILNGLLNLLPDVKWNYDSEAITSFLDVIRVCCYMLPMDTVSTIFALICSLLLFRVVVSIVKTLWQLIPLL